MRLTTFLFAALLPLLLLSQNKGDTAPAKIEWVSVERVQELVKTAPRPVIMDVYTDWCGPCRMLAGRTFTDPRVVDFVNTHFYAVKFNAESADSVTFRGQIFTNPDHNPALTQGRNGTHQFTYAIANVNGRIAYPTVVYLDSDLNVLAPVQGYFTPEQIEPLFRFFGEGKYKDTAWEEYTKDFKATWAP